VSADSLRVSRIHGQTQTTVNMTSRCSLQKRRRAFSYEDWMNQRFFCNKQSAH